METETHKLDVDKGKLHGDMTDRVNEANYRDRAQRDQRDTGTQLWRKKVNKHGSKTDNIHGTLGKTHRC